MTPFFLLKNILLITILWTPHMPEQLGTIATPPAFLTSYASPRDRNTVQGVGGINPAIANTRYADIIAGRIDGLEVAGVVPLQERITTKQQKAAF